MCGSDFYQVCHLDWRATEAVRFVLIAGSRTFKWVLANSELKQPLFKVSVRSSIRTGLLAKDACLHPLQLPEILHARTLQLPHARPDIDRSRIGDKLGWSKSLSPEMTLLCFPRHRTWCYWFQFSVLQLGFWARAVGGRNAWKSDWSKANWRLHFAWPYPICGHKWTCKNP